MDVFELPLEQIIPYARNPRNNTQAIATVAASIQEFGWRQPIVVDEAMVVLAGHTRLEAARKLVDYILSREVEALLAAAKSAQIPVRDGVKGPPAEQIKAIGSFRPMAWKPLQTATDLDRASQAFAERFGG